LELKALLLLLVVVVQPQFSEGILRISCLNQNDVQKLSVNIVHEHLPLNQATTTKKQKTEITE
jgi:hypothetical protein